MWLGSKNPLERNREEKLIRTRDLKLKRDLDASQAMKDHQAARQEALAKTARLRAERLAREANEIPAKKTPRTKKM